MNHTARIRSAAGIALAVAVLMGAPAAQAAAACGEPHGDLDGNLALDVVDVQCSILSTLAVLSGGALPVCLAGPVETADLNCDSATTVVDVQLTITLALGSELSPFVDADGSGCPDACEVEDPPVGLVIGEVAYLPAVDDFDIFVEIYGPAGTPLAGTALVGINGNGGAPYMNLPLGGAIPEDGYFVIAHPEGPAWITDQADFLTEDFGLQFGPDSLQLTFGETVLDAVAYGAFTPSDVFAGEVAAAPIPPVGQAIGRDAFMADTDDNSADFHVWAPSPGTYNDLPNVLPTAVLTCPQLIYPRHVAFQFSAEGSTDPDGSIVQYQWDWGGAQTNNNTSAPTTSRNFVNLGAHLVTLTVVDNEGGTATDSCWIIVDGTCGNGVLDPGEQCDDANEINNDSCTWTCTINPVSGSAGTSTGSAAPINAPGSVCTSISWGEFIGEASHYYKLVLPAAATVNIEFTDSDKVTCPDAFQPFPCSSGPANDQFYLLNSSGGQITTNGSGGAHNCPGVESYALAAGTYFIRYRAQSGGAGFDCNGTASYCLNTSWTYTGAFCGDGTCDGLTEDCGTCPYDCGACCGEQCGDLGNTQCTTDPSPGSFAVCVDTDADGCRTLEEVIPCAAGEQCFAGTCLDELPQQNIVINEVLYDSAGADLETFVELHGPPGLSLNGYSLLGFNGNDGLPYNEIPLSGFIPADGFFVVASPTSGAAVLAEADLLDDNTDYQNGPDNLVLMYTGTVVDAVGYGDFAGAIFLGEAFATVDPPSGQSIGRDALSTDTDVNGADFSAQATVSPGAVNPPPPPM